MHRSLPAATALATLLIAAGALAAPPEPAPPAAGTGVGASQTRPKLSPADQKRVTAIEQYQHDLVSVVALRANPDYLLGAAILARPFKRDMPELTFGALTERAAAAPGADAAVQWARLGDCKDKSDCPNSKAFAYLKQHAADNAAVWVVAMDVAARDHDKKAEKAALAKAAAATRYDDYRGKALGGVAKAVGVLPPLPDTTAGAHDGQPDNPDGVRVLVAVNAVQGFPQPDLSPVVDACTQQAVAGDAHAKEACLKLAHTLVWGSSPVGRAAGLHIQGELAANDATSDGQASRNLAWQVQQYSGLLQRALTDQSVASRWLAAARNGGTELSLILATLRANNIPIDAPAGSAPASAASGPQSQ